MRSLKMEEPLRILIVDDDQVDRMAVRRALLKSGLAVTLTEATTCTEAIALLTHNLFDCTFLDYGLPDRNGLKLVETARQLNVQHPLVVLTGQGDEKIAVDLMKAGATDYLTKANISPSTLAQVLRNAIRIDRAERAVLLTNQQLQANNALLLQQNHHLEVQRTQIEIQNLQREDFIAHLTHDLRTPLVAANLMFKLFQQEAFCPLSADMHEAVAAMDRSNYNLLEMVNTLLEVNCYEAGTKNLTLTTCCLWDIIQEVVQELQPLAQSKSIAFTANTHLADPQGWSLLGDYQELRRMVTNLVGNGLKFTDEGSITLSFGYSPATAASIHGWLTLDVRDTGPGISAAEQAIIFQRFRTGQHRRAGSGLGLHLVQRIVTTHHGTIEVTSQLGQGSLFQVRLPALAQSSISPGLPTVE
jgi:two-component system, sensor histidine kinase and response regulator